MKTVQVSDASIIAVEPGQIGGLEDNGERISLSGWVLLWSPALLHGSELERQIDRYQFFSYFFTDSLRMEPDEWDCITQLVTQMRHELQAHDDSPSLRSVLLAYLRLILEYCNRIYLRQLSEEDKGGSDLLKRFHNLLQQYFRENRQLSHGLPSVSLLCFRAGIFFTLFRRHRPQGHWRNSYRLHPQLRHQPGQESADERSQHQRDLTPPRLRFPPPFHPPFQAHHRPHAQRVFGEISEPERRGFCSVQMESMFPSIRSYVSIRQKGSFQTLGAFFPSFGSMPIRLYLHPNQTLIAFLPDFKRKNNNLTM